MLNYGYKTDVNGINFGNTKMKELRTEPWRMWTHLSSSARGDNPKAAPTVNGIRNKGIIKVYCCIHSYNRETQNRDKTK